MTPTQEFFERQIRAWNDNNVIGNYDYKPLMDRHVHEIAAHLYGNFAQVEVGLVHELAEVLRRVSSFTFISGDHDVVCLREDIDAALARVEEWSKP